MQWSTNGLYRDVELQTKLDILLLVLEGLEGMLVCDSWEIVLRGDEGVLLLAGPSFSSFSF